MDIITHLLAGVTTSAILTKVKIKYKALLITFGALVPDIGEIVIQKKLNLKYGEAFGVYDERTSDIDIAANGSVTFLYDILHSLTLPICMFIVASILIKKKNSLSHSVKMVAIGLLTHIALDCFTHGKVWALKLFFPILNQRFPILANSVGNWWDWQPQIKIAFFNLPAMCFLLWFFLVAVIVWRVIRRET
jgi:membrane-bound metal-dependent hydrolase YbcI (DUF457 family)